MRSWAKPPFFPAPLFAQARARHFEPLDLKKWRHQGLRVFDGFPSSEWIELSYCGDIEYELSITYPYYVTIYIYIIVLCIYIYICVCELYVTIQNYTNYTELSHKMRIANSEPWPTYSVYTWPHFSTRPWAWHIFRWSRRCHPFLWHLTFNVFNLDINHILSHKFS